MFSNKHKQFHCRIYNKKVINQSDKNDKEKYVSLQIIREQRNRTMSSIQIFKEKVPVDFLCDFLDKICDKTNDDKYYVLNTTSHKKMFLYNYQVDFMNTVLNYYQNSKRFYVERALTYKSLANIIRQICKSHFIPIQSRTVYFDSKYWMEYLIPTASCLLEINAAIV